MQPTPTHTTADTIYTAVATTPAADTKQQFHQLHAPQLHTHQPPAGHAPVSCIPASLNRPFTWTPPLHHWCGTFILCDYAWCDLPKSHTTPDAAFYLPNLCRGWFDVGWFFFKINPCHENIFQFSLVTNLILSNQPILSIIYMAELRVDEFGMTFLLWCSKHLGYEFHMQYIMPSWCGGITYHEWLKYRGCFSPLTMIGISVSLMVHQPSLLQFP